MRYSIKQKLVDKPEIELPDGSQVVSVKHHGQYNIEDDIEIPECWLVVWLEPMTTPIYIVDYQGEA